MDRSTNPITIVVGASPTAEELRRWLTRHGLTHVSVGTHMRGLRRAMTLGLTQPAVMCIALDQPTLVRHGKSIQNIVSTSFENQMPSVSIGLLPESGLTPETAQIGCDVYVNGYREALRAIYLMKKEWRRVRHACGEQEFERFKNLGHKSQDFSDVLSDYVPGKDRYEFAARMSGKHSWSPLDFVD